VCACAMAHANVYGNSPEGGEPFALVRELAILSAGRRGVSMKTKRVVLSPVAFFAGPLSFSYATVRLRGGSEACRVEAAGSPRG